MENNDTKVILIPTEEVTEIIGHPFQYHVLHIGIVTGDEPGLLIHYFDILAERTERKFISTKPNIDGK